jgi:hypothetical protein
MEARSTRPTISVVRLGIRMFPQFHSSAALDFLDGFDRLVAFDAET